MPICILLHMNMRVSTDLIGDLDFIWNTYFSWYWNTDLAGDMARVLYWLLVALSVLLSMALGSTGVTILRLSLRLSFSLTLLVPMTMSNDLRIMTNNSRAVVDLCVGCMALGGEGFFTLFNIGGVNNGFADRAGDFALILYWLLMALPFLLFLTLWFT